MILSKFARQVRKCGFILFVYSFKKKLSGSDKASPTIWSCYANFSVFMDCKSNRFAMEMNNDHELNLHSSTKLSVWLRSCCLGTIFLTKLP